MKKKISNEELEKNIKKRKILWYLIIIFGICTITLAILSLTINISPLFAIISFALETIATSLRNKIVIDNIEE